jgi:hypothetical protein
MQRHLQRLRESMSADGAAPIRAELKEIVPEYSYRSPEQQQEGSARLARAISKSPSPALRKIANF